MNPLVKKEIRLILPAWIVAVLLALVQSITRPYDFYVASLLFFGLTIMALSTIGRETSLNTFSSLLAQPVEKVRIWKIKLTVLSVAFLSVFAVWLIAFIWAVSSDSSVQDVVNRENSYNLFITVCLIGMATFTGGLWTTLLLRQLASAFWLTLLLPAVLSGFAGALSAQSGSDNLVIAVMSVVVGIYSLAGFLFSRRFFFRAQDVGWSGGTIELPEWRFASSRSETTPSTRQRKPVWALFKKEVLLHQATLTGAAGLLVLHLGVVVWRGVHHFPHDSAGEILTSIVWMLWLVLPVIIGSLAVAEERKLGVMESLLCLPVSRRKQFAIKTFVALSLGIFLGGVMPALLETLGLSCGSLNPMFMSSHTHFDQAGFISLSIFLLGLMIVAGWLALVSYFASSLAKNFLQAVGIGLVTFVVLSLVIPFGADTFFHFHIPPHSVLLMLIAIPTVMVTLLWQTYLNFKSFREGWAVWRRTLLGMAGAILFILVSSSFIYNRGWECFEPAEPPHAPGKLSLANPPAIQNISWGNLLIRLPDGRAWFNHYDLGAGGSTFSRNHNFLTGLARVIGSPQLMSAGPERFFAGSNWITASTYRIDETDERKHDGTNQSFRLVGYAQSVGLRDDGTLWASGQSDQTNWTSDKLTQVGTETNWKQLVRSHQFNSLLLKTDGTLWSWRFTNRFDLEGWPDTAPDIRNFPPQQVGTAADWSEIVSANGFLARKTNGSVWTIQHKEAVRETNYDQINLQTCSELRSSVTGAFVQTNGTLWLCQEVRKYQSKQMDFRIWQADQATNWIAVVKSWGWMVALKSDGTLWHWGHHYFKMNTSLPPERLGIHNDWTALTSVQGGVVTLAADGSLWFWPDQNSYEYQQLLLKLPKQPQRLGNVLTSAP